MREIILLLFFIVSFFSYSQSEQDIKILKIIQLKKEIKDRENQIKKILNSDPEVKKILSVSHFDLFENQNFKFEMKKFINFLKENDIDKMENFLQDIKQSDQTKQISNFLIFEMNKVRKKLKKEIEKLPKKQ